MLLLRNSIVFIIFFFTSQISTLAFDYFLNDTSGIKGEYTNLRIEFADIGSDYLIISGELLLKNPTIFLPEYFTEYSNCSIISSSISRVEYQNSPGVNDSLYKFELNLKINNQNENVQILLNGECLAGSDTITNILFRNIIINDSLQNDKLATLTTFNISPIDNYVRFPNVYNIFPNPVNAGETLYFDFFIDKNSDMKVFIYNTEGKARLVENIKDVRKGTQRYSYDIPEEMAAGMYYIIIEANTGSAYKKFMVAK